MDPLPRIPDGIEPITAYRMWIYRAEPRSPGAFLYSMNGSTWEKARWNIAHCLAGVHQRQRIHDVPAEGCSCGIYAMSDLDHLFGGRPAMGSPTGVIIGKVHLAGKVIEHDHGYRAQLARIVELLPVEGQERDAAELAVAYETRISKGQRERPPKPS